MVAMLPLSKYRNGSGRLLAGQPPLDLLGRVPAALDRHLGHAGQPVQRHHVADREDLRVPGHGAGPG